MSWTEVLARAAGQPDGRVDVDDLRARVRHRRRRRLAGGAVTLSLLLVALSAAIAWDGPGQDDTVLLAPDERDADPPTGGGPDGADTPEGRAEIDLEVREEQVPRCGEVELRPHNTGEIALWEQLRLDRFDPVEPGWYRLTKRIILSVPADEGSPR